MEDLDENTAQELSARFLRGITLRRETVKKPVLLFVLTLATSMAAFADGIDIINQYGSVTVSTSGITSRGSLLKTYGSIFAGAGQALGNVNFGTGALTSGSIASGGTFSSVGSYFDITSMGTHGMPKGNIFTGTFVGPILWTLTSVGQMGNSLTYTLSGEISGMMSSGQVVSGTATETIFSSKGQLAQGIGHIKGGNANLSVPEPNTLALLGTGIVSLAGVFRRKLMI